MCFVKNMRNFNRPNLNIRKASEESLRICIAPQKRKILKSHIELLSYDTESMWNIKYNKTKKLLPIFFNNQQKKYIKLNYS